MLCSKSDLDSYDVRSLKVRVRVRVGIIELGLWMAETLDDFHMVKGSCRRTVFHGNSKRLLFSPLSASWFSACSLIWSLELEWVYSTAINLQSFLLLSSFYCIHLHTAINLYICALRFYRRWIYMTYCAPRDHAKAILAEAQGPSH